MRILWRVLVVCGSYLAAIIGFFVALIALFAIASLLVPGKTGWTAAAAVSPAVIVGAPLVALFALATAITLTALPAAGLAVVTEFFSLRSPWIYLVAGAVAAPICYGQIVPQFKESAAWHIRPESLIFAVAGVVSGLIYWLACGRNAGKWRQVARAE